MEVGAIPEILRKGRRNATQAGPCSSTVWANLPTELLQAVLSNSDVDGIKVARVVCKGWSSVHPRLQPSVPVPVSDHSRPPRLGKNRQRLPQQAYSNQVKQAQQRSTTASTESTLGVLQDEAAASSRPRSSASRLASSAIPVIELLSRLSAGFHGELEQQGRVVLTLMGSGSNGGSDDDFDEDTDPRPSEKATDARPSQSIRGRSHGARWRSFAAPLRIESAEPYGGGISGGDIGFNDAVASAKDTTFAEGNLGPGRSPLRTVLRRLAVSHQQHLRIQHSAAAPLAGLTSAEVPCGCSFRGGGTGGGSCRSSAANVAAAAAFQPASSIVLDAARLSAATAVMPPPPRLLSTVNYIDSCPCCCSPSLRLASQRRLRTAGLGAVTTLTRISSLQLYGVRVGAGLLGRLTALSELTHLCFDTPLPANRVTVLAPLTSLQSLHISVSWPETIVLAPSGRTADEAVHPDAHHPASDEAAGGSNSAAVAAASELQNTDDGYRRSHGTLDVDVDGGSSSSSSSSSSGMEEFLEGVWMRRGAGALSMKPVSAAVASLCSLRRLTQLRLRIVCADMGRSSLPPPELLLAARQALPSLRRFSFQVLSGWQPVPRTLYNWVVADPRDTAAGLCCIRDALAHGEQHIFIWQDFDWQLRQPSPVAGDGEAGIRGGYHLVPPSEASDVGGSGASSSGICFGTTGSAASLAAMAEKEESPPAAAADVALGIRTSSNSWLGSCTDVATALNAVVGSLPGCRVTSLLLHDVQTTGDIISGSSDLRQATLEALSELRSLVLQDIYRPPRIRQGGAQAEGQAALSDPLAALIQSPSLTSLHLQTRRLEWLGFILPHEPVMLPSPQALSQPPSSPAAARALHLQHLRLHFYGPVVPRRWGPQQQVAPRIQERRRRDRDEEAEVASLGVSGSNCVSLRHLGQLAALQSLHLEACALLQLSWLPPSLHHLSLVRLTLSTRQHIAPAATLPAHIPSSGPSISTTPTGPNNVAETPLLPHLLSLSALRCVMPPLSALLPAAGCNHLTRLALAGCTTPRPQNPTSGLSAAFASATAANSMASTSRVTQGMLDADLQQLVSQCGSCLRSLHVTEQQQWQWKDGSAVRLEGLLEAGGEDLGLGAGGLEAGLLGVVGSSRSLQLVLNALPQLRGLEALSWEVVPELLHRLLAGLSDLRSLRELGVCGVPMGRAAQDSLAQLTWLRSLVVLAPSRSSRRAEAAVRQLAPRLPLCVIKCIQTDGATWLGVG